MTRSAREILGLWPWMLGIWLLEQVVAAALGLHVRSAAHVALRGFAAPDDHLLTNLGELGRLAPGAVTWTGLATFSTGVVAWLLWVLLAPLVLARIGGLRQAAALGERWLGTLAPSLATTGWHLLLRAAVLLSLAGLADALPPAAMVALMGLGLGLSQAALDWSRVRVVLHGAPGRRFTTAWAGYAELVRQPGVLALALGASWLMWCCAGAALVVVMQQGGALLWPAHLASLVATAIGLARLHWIATAAGRAPSSGSAGGESA